MDEASLRADMIEGLEHQIGETLDEPVLTALQRVSRTRSSTTGRLRPGARPAEVAGAVGTETGRSRWRRWSD